ncbi:hypothetical protein GGR41_000526 [Paenalcaligenes hominis]|uniref:Uncharacterized protein n=1 Tax=Paenalcaligenes hominis TaxID=643674 RepID=A0ABX0WPW6_9BURK|nr:hypothetical protein [Paenalcaligenes hominis]NJB64305.1 hypothetical protein [Paenalcaligenes hominis]GGE68659.1 hypothetical protein GCM10007278_15940 [Paenalcaligenes hominis]
MNVATQRDAVDCARLISIVMSQIHACLQGKREFVFVTTTPRFRPVALNRREPIACIHEAMEPYDVGDLLLSLRDDIMRTRLYTARQDAISNFAQFTVDRMTQAEKDALCASI